MSEDHDADKVTAPNPFNPDSLRITGDVNTVHDQVSQPENLRTDKSGIGPTEKIYQEAERLLNVARDKLNRELDRLIDQAHADPSIPDSLWLQIRNDVVQAIVNGVSEICDRDKLLEFEVWIPALFDDSVLNIIRAKFLYELKLIPVDHLDIDNCFDEAIGEAFRNKLAVS